MTVSVTVRNLPNEARDGLASRAARAGQSLQEYLLAQLAGLAAQPSVNDALRDMRAQAQYVPPVRAEEIAAEIREDRERR